MALFQKFKDLLPFFGFQTRACSSLGELESLSGPDGPLAEVAGDALFWHLPEKRAAELSRELAHYPFALPPFEEIPSASPGRKSFRAALSFSRYEEIAAVVEFLMSGFVAGFLADGQAYVFNPEVARLSSALRAAESHTAEDLQALLKEMERSPGDAVLRNFAGKVSVELGRSDEAARHFSEAIHACPHYAEPYSNLGTLLWQAGEKEKAFRLFAEALVRSPFNVTIQDNFIQTGFEINHVNEMDVCLRKVEKYYPEYPALLFLKALVSRQLGDDAVCRETLKRLLEREPGDERARELLAEMS